LKVALQEEKNILEEEIAAHKTRSSNTQAEIRNLEDQIRKLEKQIHIW